MKSQLQIRILTILLLNLYAASPAYAENNCDIGWELMPQQSEGYQLRACDKQAADARKVELGAWGRIVFARTDRGRQELVCDNNGDEPVQLLVGNEKNRIGHAQADPACDWEGNVYRCRGANAPQMFCSTSVAVAANTGSTPTATTSVSTRAAMFPFKYKEDIVYGVKQMRPLVASCKKYLEAPEDGFELSWTISQAGEIQEMQLRSEHADAPALTACLDDKLDGFRFNKHRFAMQYWEQRFVF